MALVKVYWEGRKVIKRKPLILSEVQGRSNLMDVPDPTEEVVQDHLKKAAFTKGFKEAVFKSFKVIK